MQKKKTMDELTKAKLIYTGELLLIAIAFIVLPILELTNVVPISERHHIIFNIITTIGAVYIISDFLWCTFSPMKRKKVSYLDKLTLIPLGIYLAVIDTIMYVNWNKLPYEYYLGFMTSTLLYIAVIYIFQAIYHWKHPIPMLIEAAEADEKEKLEKEENKEN